MGGVGLAREGDAAGDAAGGGVAHVAPAGGGADQLGAVDPVDDVGLRVAHAPHPARTRGPARVSERRLSEPESDNPSPASRVGCAVVADVTTGVTLQQALTLPTFRRAAPEVVAGRAGVDRPIRWVHATERLDVDQLLRAGDLLLTMGTGLPADDDAAGLSAFVDELVDVDSVGLVVELGRRWTPPSPTPSSTPASGTGCRSSSRAGDAVRGARPGDRRARGRPAAHRAARGAAGARDVHRAEHQRGRAGRDPPGGPASGRRPGRGRERPAPTARLLRRTRRRRRLPRRLAGTLAPGRRGRADRLGRRQRLAGHPSRHGRPGVGSARDRLTHGPVTAADRGRRTCGRRPRAAPPPRP